MKKTGTQKIETERLILRRFTTDDAEDMFAGWASDPEVARYLTWPAHENVQVTKTLLMDWCEHYEDGAYFNWAIELKDTGSVIGNISAVRVNEKVSSAEIGYCMGRSFWGRGIMSEALKAVIAYLFTQADFERVAAAHDVNNPASGRVMVKAGMRKEGILRHSALTNAGVCDLAWYSILRSEYENSPESSVNRIRNDIPILEFDPDPSAILEPGHEHLDLRLPEKAVFAFLGEAVHRYAKEHNARTVSVFETISKTFPIYVININGEDICLAEAPLGAPAAAQLMDWLIAYGVRKIISGGSCGALEDMAEDTFLVPRKALRDEGTSYHYLAPSRFIDLSPKARQAVETAMNNHHLSYREVITWSTDGFFRETKEKTALYKSEGCSVVEMECAALAACAEMRNVIWGEILFTADSLADAEHYDERNWGGDSVAYALELCVEAVLNIS